MRCRSLNTAQGLISKDATVSAEYHVGGRENGFEIKYTRKTGKLFLLF